MNIAFVTSEFVTEKAFDGGLANYVYKMAKSFLDAGHEPRVYVSSDESADFSFDGIPVKKVKIDYMQKQSFVIRLRNRLSQRDETANFISQLKIKSRALNEAVRSSGQKHDIIQYAHLGGVGYDRPRNIPSVARISSSTSLCNLYGGYGESGNMAMAQEKFEFEALRRMEAVFGPSKMVADLISKEIKEKIHLIETPFYPVKNADPSVYNDLLKDKRYALFFGSIGLIKGAGTIAEIIYDFLEANPDYYFVLVGKVLPKQGDVGDFLDYIKRKAGKHAFRVIHVQPLRHEQLYPVIQNASFCVLPSRIDNFPNTCIEAMGNGKIVIGTRGNGFEQLIQHEKNGFLIGVDDHRELLHTLNRCARLKRVEKEMMEQSALKRIELLAPDHIIRAMMDLYTNVITLHKKCVA